jgi:tRNA-specific 2-thiouridylase
MPKLKLGPTYKFMRIVVAMSGGVDSSVAAALLHEAGHEVVGLSMQLYDQREATGHGFGRCCSLDDLHDARRVAASIGIKHYVLNLERQFKDTVIANFVGEYAAGRTPIPCTHCNSDLKFSTLVDRAAGFDASTVGTGHYAQLSDDPQTGRRRLLRGRDASKDQSYFLFALTQQQLQAATFPVGGLTKPEVRAYARERGLPVADKPDSQEICFVPDGDYAQFVERQAPDAIGSGAITDANGRVLGRHDGGGDPNEIAEGRSAGPPSPRPWRRDGDAPRGRQGGGRLRESGASDQSGTGSCLLRGERGDRRRVDLLKTAIATYVGPSFSSGNLRAP